MLEQVSTSVKFLAFYTASKQGKTGLTVTVDIYNPSGTQIVTAGSATALGGGLYAYTLSTDNSSEGEYAAIFKTSDSTVDAQHIPSLWVLGRAGVENLDAATSSRLASSGYTAPANSDITAIKSKTDNLPSDPADQSLVESAISALSIPSVVQIRTEMDSNSTKLANLDTTVSSRLASSAYSAAPTTAQIATAVEGSLLNEADGQAVLNAIVGAIGNTNLSEVSLVAAVRADLERVGGKIDSIPTSSAPTASTVAGAVRTELATELGRLDASVSSRLSPSGTLATVTTLTNAPTVPTAAAIATQVRSELATELNRLDTNVASRAASGTLASDVTAIKAKTDAVNVDRINNTATTAIVGNLIAQANS